MWLQVITGNTEFDIEGNLYITKASVAANITIGLVLKPRYNQTNETS